MLSKWKRQEKKIIDSDRSDNIKMLTKKRPSDRHNKVFKLLYEKFIAARKRGLRVSFAWLYINANKLSKETEEEKRVPKNAITAFTKKYGIKLRRVQRKKRVDKTSFLPKVLKWHSLLREGLIKTKRDSSSYDKKWGRFKPNRRLNVDQVPLPFEIEVKRTYDLPPMEKRDKRAHRTWVASPGAGLEKRQCTLQICISPDAATKVKFAVIFRGTGKRISSEEKAQYHKDVDVYWQQNAWVDLQFSIQWAKKDT